MDEARVTLRPPPVGAWLETDGAARFRVWAPGHSRLELVLFDHDGETATRSLAMEPERDGYFTARVAPARAGTLYKFRVDGEGPFPDPAARALPRGVHGPAELVAPPEAFAWTDAAWRGVPLEDAVIYEVHVGTATEAGTFDALVERLDALRALGVTVIELMPVASFPGHRNWGYDGVGLWAPAAPYGGPAGLRRLVDAAHARGLAVVLDVVYNHLGPDGNYLRAFSPRYFTDRIKTPWGDAIHVDPSTAAPAREFFLANAEMWIRDYHLDGLRLDATHAIHDDARPHLLAQIAARARAAASGREVLVFVEDERNEARLVTPAARGGYGLDAVWADDFHHQLRRAFAGDTEGYYADFTGSAPDIARTLERGWFYEGQRTPRSEQPRGTDAGSVPLARFVHCIQNHDQVGNRALGDRLGASVTPAAYRAMSALLLLSPCTPLLFMGQEWNASSPFQFFTDHEPELGAKVTAGRRAEFAGFAAFTHSTVPDPQEHATFARSRLRWEERDAPGHAEVLAWYVALLALRREHPCLRARDRAHFAARAVGDTGVLLERRCATPGEARAVHVLVNVRGRLEHPLPDGARVLLYSEARAFGGAADQPPVVGGRVVLDGPCALLLELAA